MRSIQRRLSMGLVAVLLGIGLPAMLATGWLLDLGLRRYLESHLQAESDMLLSAIVRGPNGLMLDEPRLSPRYQRPLSGSYFRIDVDGRIWRSRSTWDFTIDKAGESGLNSGLLTGPGAQHLLLYRADYRRFGTPVTISVALDYQPVQQAALHAAAMALLLGGAALLVVLLLLRLTIKRALAPLEEARQQIQQLQQGRRGRLEGEVPAELEPLVTQINRLLGHTESSLKRSRDALGNLGHALKTPMAVLRTLNARDEMAAHTGLQKAFDEQLLHIEQRLARELNRARLAGEVLPGAQFDCDKELPSLIETLGLIHPQAHLVYQSPKALRLPWEREDVLEVLGNLLDNACKWAHQRVGLSIQETEKGFLIEVDDDGVGVACDQLELLSTRGTRLDEQVPGHGLGLGIVRDTVEAWGGELSMHASAWGGLQVRLDLPRAL